MSPPIGIEPYQKTNTRKRSTTVLVSMILLAGSLLTHRGTRSYVPRVTSLNVQVTFSDFIRLNLSLSFFQLFPDLLHASGALGINNKYVKRRKKS